MDQMTILKLASNSKKLDWEVELGIVIGRDAKNISEKDAPNHILGYCLINDISGKRMANRKNGAMG